MIKKIYHFIKNIGVFIVAKQINKRVTLVGSHQAYRTVSRVSLCDGALKVKGLFRQKEPSLGIIQKRKKK